MKNDSAQNEINRETKSDIKQLFSHADIANKEMGGIKIDIGVLKNDIGYMKDSIKKIDTKLWAIIIIVVSTAIGILAEK